MIELQGKISWFGGFGDRFMKEKETFALYPYITRDQITQPIFKPYYCAMRWDYKRMDEHFQKGRTITLMILRAALIHIQSGRNVVVAIPIDWGPAKKTGRLIDVSRATLSYLNCSTDSIVQVTLPNGIYVK